MDIRCACGATYTLPDTFAGDHVRCRTCNAVVPVGGPATIPVARLAGVSRPFPAALVALLVVLGLGAVVAVTWLIRRSNRFTPTQAESAEEKYVSASESFSGPAAVIDAKGDEGKIQALLEKFAAAERSGKGADLVSCLHLKRLLAEIERGGAVPGINTRKEEEDFLRGLETGLTRSFGQAAGNEMLHWNAVRIFRVKFHEERGEAQVFCSITVGDVPSKFRFWLIKDEQGWRVFDWESMEEGVRVSVMMSSFAASAGKVTPARAAALRQVGALYTQVVVMIGAGDLDGARKAIAQARKLTPPAALLAQFELLEGSVLTGLGEAEEAIRHLDAALALQPDLPLAHYLKGVGLQTLGKHDECIREEQEYLRMLGDDPDAYLQLGAAYEGLHKPGEAAEAYRKGVACAEKDVDNRFALAGILLDDAKVDEAKTLYLECCANAADPGEYVANAASRLNAARADAALLELCTRWPAGEASLYYQGRSLRRLGRYAEAEKALRSCLAIQDGGWSVSARSELAYALAHLGRGEEALALAAEREREMKPDGAYDRAYVLAATGDHEGAAGALAALLVGAPFQVTRIEEEKAFETAVGLPACKEAVVRARERQAFGGEIQKLLDSDDIAALLARADRHLEIMPDDGLGQYYRGYALHRQGQDQEAEKAFLAGVERDEEWRRWMYWRELALVCACLGRTDDALAHVAKLKGANAAYARACIHAVTKKDDEAVQELTRALKVEPNLHVSIRKAAEFGELRRRPAVMTLLDQARTSAAYLEEASSLYEAEDHEALLARSEEHLRVVPEDPNGWYHKGLALRYLKRYEEAQAAYRGGLERDEPDQHPHYWIELANVLSEIDRHVEALEFAARLEADPEWRLNGLHTRAHVLASSGRDDDAVAVLRELLEKDPSWRYSIEEAPVFADIVKRPDMQEVLKKAKGE